MTTRTTVMRWWIGLGLLGASAVAGAGWWMRGSWGVWGGAVDGAGSRVAVRDLAVEAPWVGTAGAGGGGAEPGEGRVGGDQPRRPAPLVSAAAMGQGAPALTAPMTESEVWAHYDPTGEELAYRAEVIERQAERELRRLVGVLELDEERQDRIFAALVRSSDWYHPSLQATGSSGRPLDQVREAGTPGRPSAESAVTGETVGAGSDAGAVEGGSAIDPLVRAELTPEEAGVYDRYASERDSFWAGVVEDAERQLQAVP